MKFKQSRIPLCVIALLCGLASAFAAIPAGYYTSLNGKKEADLKKAAGAIIYKFTQVSSYQNLPQYFRQTDVYLNSNRWWDMYSDEIFYTSSFSGLNREHSFPKSWWGGSEDVPAYVDLNHLYPSEMEANMKKSNYPLGEVLTAEFDNGVSKVGYPPTGIGGGAAKVFEPDDRYKGDFARTYFYMVTCYAGHLTWNNRYSWMLQNNEYPTLAPWAVALLLKWHRDDPVSQKELDRNEVVYRIQNNRNPFIDYPELAEYIWGNKKGMVFSTSSSVTGDPKLITPVQDMTLDFGEVVVGRRATKKLHFKGENLAGALSLTISKKSSTHPEMFSLSSESIQASLVNAADGYDLNVYYEPTATGAHAARLVVSDITGMDGSIGVSITGTGAQEPQLQKIVVLPASDITDDSYVANWEVPTSGDKPDYYIVTRTRYVDGMASVEELESESNSLVITDFNASTSESYSVQSVRLDYRSPMSDVVYVHHSGIDGVEMEQPLGIAYIPGGLRFICSENHTGARFYDASGKLVKMLPVITNNRIVELPRGIYFVVTDRLSRPLRVVVQ